MQTRLRSVVAIFTDLVWISIVRDIFAGGLDREVVYLELLHVFGSMVRADDRQDTDTTDQYTRPL